MEGVEQLQQLGELASSSSRHLQDENEPVMRIPNEVWVLILSQLNQRELVQARTVWRKWREVIDAHFEFTVIVHDGKTDLERVRELRIRDCLITRLLGDKDIFQYPSLLRRLRFWGPINVNCFQRIMNDAVDVEEFSLTKFALMQENLMGNTRLTGFSKVKKLELLGYMCKDESRTVAKNSSAIFTYTMPDLEKLTVNFHCDIASINQIAVSFMEFISRHTKLQNLVASLIPEANHPNEVAATRITSVVIPPAVEESLRKVQLSILRITTATKDLPIWTALLNAQTRLQDFRMHLSEGGLLTVNTTYTIGIPFDLLREPLLRNASTLTSVELKELRLSPSQTAADVHLDASVFRYATNLRKLVLYRNSDDFRRFPQYPDQPSIINLKMLPTSIEVLEISRFYCRSDDLQFVVDVLENLKNIVLVHTGNLNRLGVHGGIVESIAAKSKILTMNITPLNYYCPIENKKYDAVKAKFKMNDGDHVYFDFERFKQGLPQPARSPTVESAYAVRSFNNERQTLRRRYQNRCRAFIHPRRPCSVSVRSQAESRFLREVNLMDEFVGQHLDLASLHCRIHDNPTSAQSSSKISLSRLFHGLDLHLSNSQQMFHVAPSQTNRQRRWSGDATLEISSKQRTSSI